MGRKMMSDKATAEVFRRCVTAAATGAVLGLSRAGAQSLRRRLIAAGFDCGVVQHGGHNRRKRADGAEVVP